jgi:hypothetical protein
MYSPIECALQESYEATLPEKARKPLDYDKAMVRTPVQIGQPKTSAAASTAPGVTTRLLPLPPLYQDSAYRCDSNPDPTQPHHSTPTHVEGITESKTQQDKTTFTTNFNLNFTGNGTTVNIQQPAKNDETAPPTPQQQTARAFPGPYARPQSLNRTSRPKFGKKPVAPVANSHMTPDKFETQTLVHRLATAHVIKTYINHPVPHWPTGYQFIPKEQYWRDRQGEPPTWTQHREATCTLSGHPDDPLQPDWPWGNRTPKHIGISLCPGNSDLWKTQDMDDVHHHQQNLRNEFGDLSPNLMVVFRGVYKLRLGERINSDGVQIFHHLKCEILTSPEDLLIGQQSVWRGPVSYCYQRGTHLIQIQVAKQFNLRMCQRCLDLFTKGQQELWNLHSFDL